MNDIPCLTRTCEHGSSGDLGDHAGEVESTVEPVLALVEITAHSRVSAFSSAAFEKTLRDVLDFDKPLKS